MEQVCFRNEGGIAYLTVNAGPINTLTETLIEHLFEAVKQFVTDDTARVAVLLGDAAHFSAGAHPDQIAVTYNSDVARPLIELIESARKPIIAAIRGDAFGSALEIALSCHWRIAEPDARFAFPEIMEGLPPGAGATQRLPRLIPARRALEMLISGSPVSGAEAHRVGLVDELVAGKWDEGVSKFARQVADERGQAIPTRERPVIVQGLTQVEIDQFAAEYEDQWVGMEAQPAVVKLLKLALTSDFESAYQKELEAYLLCENSPQRTALRARSRRREFVQWRPLGLSPNVKPEVSRVSVVASELPAEFAGGRAATICRWMTPEAFFVLASTDDLHRKPGAEVFVLVGRNGSNKLRAMLRAAEAIARPEDVIICAGGQAEQEVADAALRPERVMNATLCGGMPYTLIEFHASGETSKAALAVAITAMDVLGLIVVHSPGIVALGHRLTRFWTEASNALVAHGMTAEQIDAALLALGFRGSWLRTPPVETGTSLRDVSQENKYLVLCAFANSACRLLDDRVAAHPEDVDVVAVEGFGFPAAMKGPMAWAQSQDARKLVADLTGYSERYGSPFEPARLLRRVAGEMERAKGA